MLVGFLMPAIWCIATGFIKADGYSGIPIKELGTHNHPKTSSIQASIFTLSNGDEYYGEFSVTN
ncbi:MAG: hypothetical protein IKR29_03995 [Bacteroidales bacterium]|nr:hypothetical protein [Bacteroidales bacterium]